MRSRQLDSRLASPRIQFLDQEGLGGGCEKGGCETGGDDGVEVDACPDKEGGWEGEEHEGGGGEGEDELGYEVGEDVVVDF